MYSATHGQLILNATFMGNITSGSLSRVYVVLYPVAVTIILAFVMSTLLRFDNCFNVPILLLPKGASN